MHRPIGKRVEGPVNAAFVICLAYKFTNIEKLLENRLELCNMQKIDSFTAELDFVNSHIAKNFCNALQGPARTCKRCHTFSIRQAQLLLHVKLYCMYVILQVHFVELLLTAFFLNLLIMATP